MWRDTRTSSEKANQRSVSPGEVVITHTDFTIGDFAGVRHVIGFHGPGFMPFSKYRTGKGGKNGSVTYNTGEEGYAWACECAKVFYEGQKADAESRDLRIN